MSLCCGARRWSPRRPVGAAQVSTARQDATGDVPGTLAAGCASAPADPLPACRPWRASGAAVKVRHNAPNITRALKGGTRRGAGEDALWPSPAADSSRRVSTHSTPRRLNLRSALVVAERQQQSERKCQASAPQNAATITGLWLSIAVFSVNWLQLQEAAAVHSPRHKIVLFKKAGDASDEGI